MFKILEEIQELRKEQTRLAGKEAELSTPLLTDFTLLPLLYHWFNEINEAEDFAPRSGSILQRNKFIIIALRFYSPLTLLGEKMVSGLRNELVNVLNLNTPTTVSNACSDLIFYYHQYRSFREQVNKLYHQINRQLENYLKEKK